ncbi:ribonuclease H1-like isoform X1 [Lampetra planeri]
MLRTPRGLLLLVRAERRGYYAVRIGRSPGLYATWDECRTQVEGFPGADFRKFLCEGTAHAYLAQGRGDDGAAAERPPRSRRRRWEDEEQPAGRGDQPPRYTYVGGVPVVFTDGCCISNGRHAARAGLGVFWGTNNSLNLSERLVGRQTNQRAEIMVNKKQNMAACRAVQQASEQGLRKLIVCTDSMFIVNGMGSWVHTWKRSGWRQGSGSLVVNRADFALLDDLCSDMDITWVHVQGHSGNLGNEHADQLAKEGADKVPLPGAKPPPDPVATAVEPPDLGQPSAVGQRVDPEDVDCASQADLAAKVDSSEPEEIRQTNLKKSIDVASWTL